MHNIAADIAVIPVDYYLKNFHFLVDWVATRYNNLLSADEQQFIAQFRILDKNSQCLLVRLGSRKGSLFRRDKLNYSEIACIDTAAQQLADFGLLYSDPAVPVTVLASVLTKVELLCLFAEPLSKHKQARKDVLVALLAEQYPATKTWREWTNKQFGELFYCDNQSTISTLLLLFFGNAYQDLSEFVLQDLGLLRYEDYDIDPQHRVFNSRTELQQYQYLLQLRQQLEDDCSAESLLQLAEQLPNTPASEKLHRRRARLCNQIAYALERHGEYQLATRLYSQSHLPPARERQIRLLEKQQHYAAAWELLKALLDTPVNEHERQIALRMAPRLAKKCGVTFVKTNQPDIYSQHLVLPRLFDEQDTALRVEEVLRLSLNDDSTPCVYAENALITGLFGLWLWPEMFRGVAGAFANPFQAAPLDLYQENFVTKRPGIAALWTQLDNEQYRQILPNTWQNKFGITNHLVNWSFLNREVLYMALHCIPAAHLKAIFKRLLFDIKDNRSGLPDLIQFFPEQKAYKMVEVKGPGDRIQDNQQRWLDYFATQQIPAEVCYVSWA